MTREQRDAIVNDVERARSRVFNAEFFLKEHVQNIELSREAFDIQQACDILRNKVMLLPVTD